MSLTPDTDELIGATVGEYEVRARIGVGGMGVVYEGVHPVIGKRVAIKVLMPQLSAQTELVQRFLAEARAVNAIRHRGIVDIFSFGSLASGALYFVMEYLEGESLDKVIERRGALAVSEALGIVEEILDALAAAHDAHVVHRDIKPSNLFLVSSPRGKPYIKLLDFGIAKLTARDQAGETPQTRASVIMGTPDYIAPEQARGGAITPQTDLYAVGVVLYELITGFRPFRGDNPIQTMWMHLDSPTPRPSAVVPDLPPLIDALVLWAMQKKPEDRPRSADHLREVVSSLGASFARNALGSPLTPSGSPRPLSAIDGLPDEMRQAASSIAPKPETGSLPTVQGLEPVHAPEVERTDPSGPRSSMEPAMEAAGLTPEPRTAVEPPGNETREDVRLPISMLQTVIQPPRRPLLESLRQQHAAEQVAAPVNEATRIERPPPPAPAPVATMRETLPGDARAEDVAHALDHTPLAIDLASLRGEPAPTPSRAIPLLLGGVGVVLVALAVFLLAKSNASEEEPPVVVVVDAGPASVDVAVVPPVAAALDAGSDLPLGPDAGAGQLPSKAAPDAGAPLAVPRPPEDPRTPRRPTVTQAVLEQRLVALEKKLEARERSRGEPDRMLRKYFSRVRDELNEASTEADRRGVQRSLDELTQLLR